MPRSCSTPTTARSSCPTPAGRRYRAIVAIGEIAEQLQPRDRSSSRRRHHRQPRAERPRRVHQRHRARTRAALQIPGTPKTEDERLMVAPLLAGQGREGRDGGLAHRRPAVRRQRARVPRSGLSLQATVAIENARLFAESQQRAAELDTDQHGLAAARRASSSSATLLELVGEQMRTRVQRRHRLRGAARPANRHDPLPVPVRRVGVQAAQARRGPHQQDHRDRQAADPQQRGRPAQRRTLGAQRHRPAGAARTSACRSSWAARARA